MKSNRLSNIGFGISVYGLMISSGVIGLYYLNLVPDILSLALHMFVLILLVPFSIIGLLISIIATLIHRDRIAGTGIIVGLLATIASLYALLATTVSQMVFV